MPPRQFHLAAKHVSVMREIEAKRTSHSKTFDLGNGQRRLEIGQQPQHFEQNGKWVDIDLDSHETDELGHHVLRQCPYTLKISRDRPAYEYTSLSGKRVDVELVTNAGVPVFEGGLFKWNIGRDTDYVIQPLPAGCTTLLVLQTPRASRVWSWRVLGDIDLIVPLVGKDSGGRHLELIETRDKPAGTITVEWTGRTIAPRELRRAKQAVWTDDITWPVIIDPTVNENIAANADDVFSAWAVSGAVFSTFIGDVTGVNAGRVGTYRTYGGVRFQTIAVPAGATINAATLTVRLTSVTGSPDLNIYGNAVDDAAAFASPGNRVKSMTKTSAVTNKTAWTSGADNDIAVTSIVAEILGRAGWASNNDIAFGLFNNKTTGTHRISFAALEHATLTEARLSIDYTAAGAGGAVLDHYVDKPFAESRFVKSRFLGGH
jgi:hypothetical protein